MATYNTPGSVPPRSVTNIDVETDVRPTDRVRWAAILAGIFTVLAALIVFTVLAFALGLSGFDASNIGSFGIGAGIFGAVFALIAFFLGGFIAARTAAVAGTQNGILHGGMVWIVGIVLIVNFIGSGIGTVLNVAGSAASTAAQVAAPVVAEVGSDAAVAGATAVAENPELQVTAAAGATQAGDQLNQAATQVSQQLAQIDEEDVNQAVQSAGTTAWWTLLALGISAAAALIGGASGARRSLTQELTRNS